MYCDLRTTDSAHKFVLDFLGLNPEEFKTQYYDQDFERFWKQQYYKIKSVDISNLRIIAFHVLGSLDNCEEIKRNGLWNLQMVLSEKTRLSSLLRSHGIYFDIPNKILYSNQTQYDVDYERYRNSYFLNGDERALKAISYRLYYDFCINGFLVNDDVFSYGTQIHERPEFLMTLCELFIEVQENEYYWKTHAKSYRVDFYATIDQIARFVFELDSDFDPPYEGWRDLSDNMKIKKWLLSHAINRANDELNTAFIYIKNDRIVPPGQIISCSRI